MVDPKSDGPDHEGPQEGNDSTQLPASNLPLNDVESSFQASVWPKLLGMFMTQYMKRAQTEVRSDTRGAKQQLLVDRAVSRDCKTRKTNLCNSWIDNKKAYHSMPYR